MDDEELSLTPHNVIDPVRFGRRLRSLRVLEGYDRASDLVESLRRRTGVEVSERTLYAVERGEQPPAVDLFFGLLVVLNPPEGMAYFLPALRTDLQDTIRNQL